MARRDLSAEAMLALSGPWLNPDGELALLQSHPLNVAVIPLLERAHNDLLRFDVSNARTEVELRIADLTARLTRVDADHDRLARGIHGLLTSLAELSDEPDDRELLLSTRDALLPLGLRETQRTYLEQTGNLERVRQHVLPRAVPILRTVSLAGGRTLEDAVLGWSSLGGEFETLGHSRRTLQAELDALTPEGNVQQARNVWIRVVNAMLSNVNLVPMSPADEDRLFGPLREAEDKAGDVPPAATRRAVVSTPVTTPTTES